MLDSAYMVVVNVIGIYIMCTSAGNEGFNLWDQLNFIVTILYGHKTNIGHAYLHRICCRSI